MEGERGIVKTERKKEVKEGRKRRKERRKDKKKKERKGMASSLWTAAMDNNHAQGKNHVVQF